MKKIERKREKERENIKHCDTIIMRQETYIIVLLRKNEHFFIKYFIIVI